tara:strand:- start:1153 stop:1773 length:621 start_codon:yes stop_codon:yes gene_type:complete
MSTIKITKEEIEKIVREANQELLEDFTYPFYGNELAVARKEKLGAYEKYVNTCLQALKMMVENVNSDYVNNNISDLEVNFLVDDQLERLQAAVGYTVSSLQAIVKHDGQKLQAAGSQFPSMMEEQEEEEGGLDQKEKVSASDMKKAGYEQGKEASKASGIIPQERTVIKQLNDLLIKASTEGNIIPGKAGRLIKMLAAELQTLIKK